MTNPQNELSYHIAWSILRQLLEKGLLTRQEFDAAHKLVVEKYRPLTVREKDWISRGASGSVAC